MFCKSQETRQVSSGARSRKSRFMRCAAAPEKVQRRRFLEGGHEPQAQVRRGPGVADASTGTSIIPRVNRCLCLQAPGGQLLGEFCPTPVELFAAARGVT